MKRTRHFLNRRKFLGGATGVAVGLPLLESIGIGPLSAQEQSIKRFVCFHCSSGVDDERFWPTIGGFNSSSFSGRGIEPLTPYFERVVIPRGVHGYPVGQWTGHLEGTIQALTASRSQSELATGPSVDQIIAQAVNPGGREALVLKPGGRDRGVVAFNSISYRDGGQLVDAESNPWRAYQAMMGLNTSTEDSGDPGPTLDADSLRRQSVLDLVSAEFGELESLDLSRTDREKLDQHFQLIRDVEVTMGNQSAAVGCNLDAGTVSELEGIDAGSVEDNSNFPTMARLSVQVTALAIACDYTRSAVIQWGAAVAGSPMYQWDGIDHRLRHHPISHGTEDDNDFGSPTVAGYKDMLFDIDRWNITEFKNLLDLLDGYTEGDGTVLDSSVVLYSNEFSNGQGHTTGDLPYIIAGGAGYFRTGRSVEVDGNTARIGGTDSPRETANSNKLLATVLNAVGVPTPQFSDGPEGELVELKT